MSERIKTAVAATRASVEQVLKGDDAKLLQLIRMCIKNGCKPGETAMLLSVLEDHFEARIRGQNSKV